MHNIVVIILLIVLLILAVSYGCCGTMELFENEKTTPMKKTVDEEIDDAIKEGVEKHQKKEDEEKVKEVKDEIEKQSAELSAVNAENRKKAAQEESQEEPVLNKQEQELFDQITKNSIPSADLEKLIRAGVLTENMVEKFLNQIDKISEEKIEGFCAGQDCYATLQ